MKYSILLGSGFSVPKGLPSVSSINEKFTNLKVEDIIIGPNRSVGFLNGQIDPNGWMTEKERLFFVEFIDDYCKQIGGAKKFHYEEFFDYYHSYYQGREENDNIESFCEKFKLKNETDTDNANLLLGFNNIFTQLLASLLRKKEFYENSVFKMDYRPYDDFVNYLEMITNTNEIVNIHTLNHDIFFEHLAKSTKLQSKFTDGYTEMGSPYYGDLEVDFGILKNYKVRIKYFNNQYNKSIRLYKLHGSIDTYYFNNLSGENFDKTRIKGDFKVFDFYKEVEDHTTGEKKYIKGYYEQFPDFLSGTTEKLRSYNNEYYKILFDHFKYNLSKSEKLLIIGYGFWDKGINKFIKEYFISRGKIPTVISPNKSTSPFYKENEFNHISKSIGDVKIDELLNI